MGKTDPVLVKLRTALTLIAVMSEGLDLAVTTLIMVI